MQTAVSPLSILKGVLDSSLNGVAVYEAVRNENGAIADFRVGMINARHEEDLGVTADMLVGHYLSEFPLDATQLGLVEGYKEVIHTGKPLRRELEYQLATRPDPTWFDVYVVKMEDSVVVTYNDITPLKRLNEQVTKQANLLQGIIDSSLNGVAVYEAVRDASGGIVDFRFLHVNEKASQLTGIAPERFRGNTIKGVYPNSEQTGLFRQYVAVCETGVPYRADHYYPDLDLWADIRIVKLHDGLAVSMNNITASKKAEIARKQETDLVNQILETAQTGMMLLSAVRDGHNQIVDFRIEKSNKKNLELRGWQGTQPEGGLLTHIDPQARIHFPFDRWIEITDTGVPARLEYFFKPTAVWLDVSISRIGDGVLVSAHDITAVKQAQLAHQSQSELLQQVIDSSQAGIVLLRAVRDAEGKIVDYTYLLTNPLNAAVLNRPLDQIIGHRLLDLFPSINATGLFDRLVEVTETGQEQRFETHFQADGFDVWLNGYIIKKDDGVLFTFIDINPIKQAQLAYQHQAQLLESVLNTSLSALACCEAVRNEAGRLIDIRFTLVNRVAAEWMKIPTEQVLNRPLLSLFPNFPLGNYLERLETLIETGEPFQFEYPFRSRTINLSLAKLGDGVVISASDITAARRYQQELERSNQELKRSNDNLQQFAYVASHDLQEPLRKIQSFGDVLHMQLADQVDESQTDLIRRMQQAATRMHTLIHDLLTYSRVSTHREPFKPLSLSALFEELQADLEVSIQEKKAQIKLENLPNVTGDRLQLQQLFQNLLSNALKFSRPDVPPVITISSREVIGRSVADLPASEHNTTFHEICVQDNGIGFDPKYLDRIFQVFQRLHGRNQYPGTGIGLAICKKVIENHKGYITATSRPNEGATFCIYLPA